MASPTTDFFSLKIHPDPDGPTPYRTARKSGNVLLYLPRELRDELYEVHSRIEIETTAPKAIENPNADYKPAALMQACKQMWLEIERCWLKNHTFVVDDPSSICKLMSWLDSKKRFDPYQYIEHLAIVDYDGYEIIYGNPLYERCRHIQRLDIAISPDDLVDFAITDIDTLDPRRLFKCCKQMRQLRIHIHTAYDDSRAGGLFPTETTTNYHKKVTRAVSSIADWFETGFKENDTKVVVSCIWFRKQMCASVFYSPSIFGKLLDFDRGCTSKFDRCMSCNHNDF
ncbi:hypothetical protein N0V90_005821 [Kalmusia sp. IMI 367209]|nr:hypothetical protein N0V90_005821 [Kalmusia sp. IMI 367209]